MVTVWGSFLTIFQYIGNEWTRKRARWICRTLPLSQIVVCMEPFGNDVYCFLARDIEQIGQQVLTVLGRHLGEFRGHTFDELKCVYCIITGWCRHDVLPLKTGIQKTCAACALQTATTHRVNLQKFASATVKNDNSDIIYPN